MGRAKSSALALLGRDFKGKVSAPLYAVAVGGAFLSPWLAGGVYVLVALMWLIPDRRIERELAHGSEEK